MTNLAFIHHRDAALALLNECPDLPHKTAGFLGNVSVASILSDRQHAWLEKLLAHNGFPPLAEGGSA